MDFKTGILVMLVGIAMIGFAISDTVAYTFTVKCNHPEAGTAAYNNWPGDENSYFMCKMYDPYGDEEWNWEMDSNVASSFSGSFYGSTPAFVSGYAYNSGAIDTPKCSSCDKNTWYVEAFSGKDRWGEFGAWTICADN